MMAKNNIKKSKVATATLVILIAITTIFLYVGFSVLTNINSFIDDKNTELNGAHFISIIDGKYDQDVKNILESIDGYQYMEREDAITNESANFQDVNTGEKQYSMPALLLNIDTKRTISTVNIIDKAEAIPENGVIVPYVLKASNGCKTGDTLKLIVNDDFIEFQIAGFYEDVIFANPVNVSEYKLFIYDKKFHELLNHPEIGIKCSYIGVITNNISDSANFEKQYTSKLKSVITDQTGSYASLNYASMKIGTSIFINIIMAILIGFSIIILSIALIVIKFSTTTHIENNIKNIGAMEAIGYTTKQILNSILIEDFMIAIVGYIIGIITSIGVSPLVSGLVSSSIGLKWITNISLSAILVSLIVIVISVLGISYFSAAKIKKITPLTALRNGIETHNFKKNRIPLDKTKLGINTAIGFKGFLYNKKQNIVVGIIVMLLSAVCIFSFSMYYNFAIDYSEMMRLVGMETADVQLIVQTDEDRIFSEIAKMPEVQNTVKFDGFESTITYNGKESNGRVRNTEDYSKLKINTCVKGRMPIYENEIAITNLMLKELGAKIGDTVSINYDNTNKEYLVVGVTQQISNLGLGATITTEGMERLVPTYKNRSLMIYLKENQSPSDFVTKVNNLYKEQNGQGVNYIESINLMMEAYKSSVSMLVTGCIVITAIIIIFVIFLIIRVRILKEKTRLGVSKALGFTSNQLITHIIISEIPVILVASIVGSILGFFGTNPVMTAMLGSNGIINCNFYTDIRFVIITPLGISIVGLLTILAVASRIKKISPCKMFDEGKN